MRSCRKVVTYDRMMVGGLGALDAGGFGQGAPVPPGRGTGDSTQLGNDAETNTCKKLRAKSDLAANRVTGWPKVPHIWNSPAKLEYYRLTAEFNAEDAKNADIIVNVVGGAISLWKPGKITIAGGASAAAALKLTLSEAEIYYEQRASDINARQDYLNALIDGNCKRL